MDTHQIQPGQKRVWGWVKDLLVVVFIAILVSFLLKTFVIRSFFIPSPSMEQTLNVDDRVLVNQLAPNVMAIKRGDVVVFRDPGGWMNTTIAPRPGPVQGALQALGLVPETNTSYLIKRVIGIGGDRVACCDAAGHLTVNGTPITEPYLAPTQGEFRASSEAFSITVPERSLWVMGDNRNNSKDSRAHQDKPGDGSISEQAVVGRAFFLHWPFSRAGWIEAHHEAFEKVQDAG